MADSCKKIIFNNLQYKRKVWSHGYWKFATSVPFHWRKYVNRGQGNMIRCFQLLHNYLGYLGNMCRAFVLKLAIVSIGTNGHLANIKERHSDRKSKALRNSEIDILVEHTFIWKRTSIRYILNLKRRKPQALLREIRQTRLEQSISGIDVLSSDLWYRTANPLLRAEFK